MAKLHLLALLCGGGGASSAFTIITSRPPKSSVRGARRQRFHPSRRKGLASGLRLNQRREFPFAPTTALGAHTDELSRALESNDLDIILPYLQSHPSSIPSLNKGQFTSIFDAVELATAESEMNTVNKRALQDANISADQTDFRSQDPVRVQMTRLYRLLQEEGRLKVFGAVGRSPPASLSAVLPSEGQGPVYPTSGSKYITPRLLETITGIEMVNLTPRPTNLLRNGALALVLLEGVTSLFLGINFNFLVAITLLLAITEQFLLSGAVSESALRAAQPETASRVTKHEAGHFLCAYLLGCPVEGVVLSTWAALKDSRFRGRSTGAVSACTAYYDLDLSEQVAGLRPLTRDSIDRYSVIVMGGIAAEAMEFGRADGGAGDEEALVRFLRSLNPRSGNAVSAWTPEVIRNQARWGATQAVLLLREYKPCYDALVEALERGGDLGQCVAAIEGAAAREGLGRLQRPLGKVSEEGEFGRWTTMDDVDGDANENGGSGSIPQVNNGSSSSTTSVPTYGEDPITSTEEFLRKYRDVMEKKLASIDEQLEQMGNNNTAVVT